MRNYIGPTAGAVLMAFMLGGFGLFLDKISDKRAELIESPSLTDAQKHAQSEMRRDIAAVQVCRETVGESFIRWTEAGQLVCVPRKGKEVML